MTYKFNYESANRLQNAFNMRIIPENRVDVMPEKQITQEQINIAKLEFFARGGRIQKIERPEWSENNFREADDFLRGLI